MTLNDFKKKWNLEIKKSFFITQMYLTNLLVGEFNSSYHTYWVSTDVCDEFVKDFLSVFAYRNTPYISLDD